MRCDVKADDALSAEDVARLMTDCALRPGEERIALAVSGGPDSMALAFAVKRWSEQNHYPSPLAFIVDHGLREESSREASEVKLRLQALGVGAEILRWEHAAMTSRLHSEARKARYRLLLEACERHGFSVLLFAHQREDQAETILMRFSKGTGLDGLAGIPAQNVMRGVRIMRPFLTVPKERLIATCAAANIPFVTDPSNRLEKFARGRMRRVLPLLAEDGLTVERLIDFGVRAAEARDALDHYTGEFLVKAGYQTEFGVIAIDKAALLAAPRAIALRGLSLSLQAIHREDYAPLHASLSLLFDAIKDEDILPPRTLNGCLISQSKKQVMMMREYAGITETALLKAGESVIWDGRWQVTLTAEAPQGYRVQALGNPPHDVLDRLSPTLRHKVPQGRIRAALPALWQDDEITVIPFLHKNAEVRVMLLNASTKFGELKRPRY